MQIIIVIVLVAVVGYVLLHFFSPAVIDDVSKAAVKSVDTISQGVEHGVRQGIDSVNSSIFEFFEPMFPWMFIIFFLLLFAALKAIIPFSNKAIIQLSLVTISYFLGLKVFYDMGIFYYAFIGTIWLLMPFVVLGTIFYFFRGKLTPMIFNLNTKLKEKMDGLQAKMSLDKLD